MAGTISLPTGSITTPNGDPNSLTAATVPLAGTELMAVYQGGEWRSVSVANLTAGRAVSASTLDITSAGTAADPSLKIGSLESGLYEDSDTRLAIASNGRRVAQMATVGATGNYWVLSANNTPTLSVTGPGADVDAFISSKGAGNVTSNVGNIIVSTAGKGFRASEGSNPKQGTATLVAGTVTVSNTSVTANSRIFLTSQTDGGTPGFLRVSARSAGTNFTITSSSGTDTSTVAYEIFEPG